MSCLNLQKKIKTVSIQKLYSRHRETWADTVSWSPGSQGHGWQRVLLFVTKCRRCGLWLASNYNSVSTVEWSKALTGNASWGVWLATSSPSMICSRSSHAQLIHFFLVVRNHVSVGSLEMTCNLRSWSSFINRCSSSLAARKSTPSRSVWQLNPKEDVDVFIFRAISEWNRHLYQNSKLLGPTRHQKDSCIIISVLETIIFQVCRYVCFCESKHTSKVKQTVYPDICDQTPFVEHLDLDRLSQWEVRLQHHRAILIFEQKARKTRHSRGSCNP